MGQATLVARIAARDLRRRPTEAALLLLAIMAAMTTLTIGLSVRGMVNDPYQSTREATSGPDVVAIIGSSPGETVDRAADVAALEELTNLDGVVGHSGPFPVAVAEMEANGQTIDVQAVGRDAASASVDQPQVTRGSWVQVGGVVVEAAFAAAKDLTVGDQVTLDGQPFVVVGIAVTAASAPYPKTTCYSACITGASPEELSSSGLPSWVLVDPGLVWVARTDAAALATDTGSMAFVLNLQLAEPNESETFANDHAPSDMRAPGLIPWQEILEESSHMVRDAQTVFLFGSGLLILMAMASVAVLVGGRMADQTRRVGLLKAVGGTPRLVAAVLLAEQGVVALLGAGSGLLLGWLIAPFIVEPSVGLVGAAPPAMSPLTIGVVIGVALVVAAIATFVPALRAARASTVAALAGAARRPRRTKWLIAISSRLPTSLLLASRMLARRPRRVVLNIVGIAVAVSGLVAVVAASAGLEEQFAAGGYRAASVERLWPVMMMVMGTLIALAAVNAVFITWATILDTRQASAVARALGATPQQMSAGLGIAQILPALAGATLGVPAGIALVFALDDGVPTLAPFWQIAAVVVAAVVLIGLLTAIPARAGGRRPVVEILQSEHV